MFLFIEELSVKMDVKIAGCIQNFPRETTIPSG